MMATAPGSDRRATPRTPEEALVKAEAQRAEAEDWLDRVDKLMGRLKTIQRENGFAPRMALAYQKKNG